MSTTPTTTTTPQSTSTAAPSTPSSWPDGVSKVFSDLGTLALYLGGMRSLRTNIESGLVSPQTVYTTKLTLGGLAAGFVTGSAIGATTRATQFLAENAHRLPKTAGGWYQYHRAKQAAMIHAGGVAGAKYGARFAVMSGLFGLSLVSIESAVGVESFLNATAAGIVTSGLFALYSRFSWQASKRAFMFGTGCGLTIGLLEDAYRLLNGTSIRLPRIGDQTWSSFFDGSRWFGPSTPSPTPTPSPSPSSSTVPSFGTHIKARALQ